jgi:DNA-binding NarL/FixJ family response regulator
MTAGTDMTEYALALLDLGRGRWSDALARLRSLADPTLSLTTLPDRVEAAVRAGRRQEAKAALERFEAAVAVSPAPWALARLEACRALVASGDAAGEHFEEALRLAAGVHAFDRARVQLLYGEHLRRARRRADARVQLRSALAAFEDCRADPWCERARGELRASGETARKRDAGPLDQLTPQEAQIAGFVAQGLSNKAVASQLFLSPRTIDAHLRNVFAKLGLSSRTQLASHMLAAA